MKWEVCKIYSYERGFTKFDTQKIEGNDDRQKQRIIYLKILSKRMAAQGLGEIVKKK